MGAARAILDEDRALRRAIPVEFTLTGYGLTDGESRVAKIWIDDQLRTVRLDLPCGYADIRSCTQGMFHWAERGNPPPFGIGLNRVTAPESVFQSGIDTVHLDLQREGNVITSSGPRLSDGHYMHGPARVAYDGHWAPARLEWSGPPIGEATLQRTSLEVRSEQDPPDTWPLRPQEYDLGIAADFGLPNQPLTGMNRSPAQSMAVLIDDVEAANRIMQSGCITMYEASGPWSSQAVVPGGEPLRTVERHRFVLQDGRTSHEWTVQWELGPSATEYDIIDHGPAERDSRGCSARAIWPAAAMTLEDFSQLALSSPTHSGIHDVLVLSQAPMFANENTRSIPLRYVALWPSPEATEFGSGLPDQLVVDPSDGSLWWLVLPIDELDAVDDGRWPPSIG